MEEKELQWANSSIKLPLPQASTRALAYLRVLLSSKDPCRWLSFCQKLAEPQGPDYSIAPRWMANHDGPRLGLPPRQTLLSCCRQRNQTSLHRELALKTGRCPRDCPRHKSHPRSFELPRQGKRKYLSPTDRRQTRTVHNHRTPSG